MLPPIPLNVGANAVGSIRQSGQRLVDVLQAARSSFSDELSRNFPRNQGGANRGANRPNANVRDLQQTQVITIICLPPGSRSVPAHAQLVAMTNSGTGFGFPSGCDSVGSIPCPTNFNSEDEFLQHLRQYFSSLAGSNTPCSWYKRTKGSGIKPISFSPYRELREAIGRGALVIIPGTSTNPINSNGVPSSLTSPPYQAQMQPPIYSFPGFNAATSQVLPNPPHIGTHLSSAPVLSYPLPPTVYDPQFATGPTPATASTPCLPQGLNVCSGSIPTLHGSSLPAVPDDLDGESSSSFENYDVSLPPGPTPLIANSVPLVSTVIHNPLVHPVNSSQNNTGGSCSAQQAITVSTASVPQINNVLHSQGPNPLIANSIPLLSTVVNNPRVHPANSSQNNTDGSCSSELSTAVSSAASVLQIDNVSLPQGPHPGNSAENNTGTSCIAQEPITQSSASFLSQNSNVSLPPSAMSGTSNPPSDQNSTPAPAPFPVEISNSFNSTPLSSTTSTSTPSSNSTVVCSRNSTVITALESFFRRQEEQQTERHIQFLEILAEHRQLLDDFRTNNRPDERISRPSDVSMHQSFLLFLHRHRVS